MIDTTFVVKDKLTKNIEFEKIAYSTGSINENIIVTAEVKNQIKKNLEVQNNKFLLSLANISKDLGKNVVDSDVLNIAMIIQNTKSRKYKYLPTIGTILITSSLNLTVASLVGHIVLTKLVLLTCIVLGSLGFLCLAISKF